MAYEPNEQRLTSGQKVGFSFMLIFAFLAVGLGMLQMRTTIYGPFINPNANQAQAVDQAQLLFDETVKLQRIDTDQDGLNDFEELNFYQTSAYLPDTDSDGISDKKEIDDGTDPLCPEGTDCGLGSVIAFETVLADEIDLENPLLEQAIEGTGAILGTNADPDLPGLQNIGSMLQDPAKLRAALLAAGQLSAEELSTITDDQLIDLAQQAIKSQSADGSGSAQPSSNATKNVTAAELQALLEKPKELRALLVSTGKMTAAQLDQIDDKTLIDVTKELILSTPS